MKLPNNGRDRHPTGKLLSLNKASSNRIRLHLVDLLTKEFHRNPQGTQTLAQIVSCSPYTDSQDPLVKTTAIELSEHGKVELMPT